MKVTKYEHACLFIEDGNGTVVIDPGSFTDLPAELGTILAVVVTEEHQDHYDLDNLKRIIKHNPQVQIYTTESVSNQLKENGIASTAITGTQTVTVDDFELTFYETDHAVVYGKSPCKSLAVKVNDYLYYPSDSYYVISEPVKILALPTSGPWYKVSESVDFAKQITSDVLISTHNAINSDAGNSITNSVTSGQLGEHRKFVHLNPGESFSS